MVTLCHCHRCIDETAAAATLPLPEGEPCLPVQGFCVSSFESCMLWTALTSRPAMNPAVIEERSAISPGGLAAGDQCDLQVFF